MRLPDRVKSKPFIAAVLMALALLALILPGRFTDSSKHLTQLLAPLQEAVHQTTGRVGDGARQWLSGWVSQADYDQLQREKRMLEHRLLAARSRLVELERAERELTGIRRAGFPIEGQLIPARVVAADAVAWRDSYLLNKGRTDGVKPGEWVASRLFLQRGKNDGVRSGLAVLARECLIGRIEAVGPVTSRVVLLSDRYRRRPTRVRIARRDESGEFKLSKDFFTLYGAGVGLMRIPDVSNMFIDSGDIRVDDLVVSPPGDVSLPVSMVIGRVARIDADDTNPLLHHLTVEPRVDASSLRSVFIVDPHPPTAE